MGGVAGAALLVAAGALLVRARRRRRRAAAGAGGRRGPRRRQQRDWGGGGGGGGGRGPHPAPPYLLDPEAQRVGDPGEEEREARARRYLEEVGATLSQRASSSVALGGGGGSSGGTPQLGTPLLGSPLLLASVGGLSVATPTPPDSAAAGASGGASSSDAGGAAAASWLLPPGEVALSSGPDGQPLTLGVGGFGRVYKGLRNGVQPVAVKALAPSEGLVGRRGSAGSLQREVSVLRSCLDSNLVQFLGAYWEAGQLCIVTEFMPERDLSNHLSRDEFRWYQRGVGALPAVRAVGPCRCCPAAAMTAAAACVRFHSHATSATQPLTP